MAPVPKSILVLVLLSVYQVACEERLETTLMKKYATIEDNQLRSSNTAGWFSRLFKHTPNTLDRQIEGYKRLSNELVKRLPSEDEVEANLRVAFDLYESEPSVDKQLKESLGSFVALSEIYGANRCDPQADVVLRLNDYLTEHRARLDDKSRNRVDNIVRQVMLKHEKECRGVYEADYKRILDQKSQAEREQMFGLLSDEFIAELVYDDPSVLANLMMTESIPLEEFQDAKQKLVQKIFKSLKDLTNSNSERFIEARKNSVNEKKFVSTYEKHLTKPCQEYVKTFDSVFEPASFDFGVSDEILYEPIDRNQVEFALALGRFEVCKSCLRQDKSLRSAVMQAASA